MTSVSQQLARRRKSALARAVTLEQQYMIILSCLLCVELASAANVRHAQINLPDRSYYHLILAISPAAQEVIGPIGKLKEVHSEILLPEGAALLFRTARVFALAEMVADKEDDIAEWMMMRLELIPEQPAKTPLELCVESQSGAEFLASHLLRKLHITRSRNHADEITQSIL